MTEPFVPARRTGLVLEGGGAKGAFQFGVLLALRDANLAFDSVSGTSVGALNGLIWSTESWEEGFNLWTGLSRSRVFSLSKLGVVMVMASLACRPFRTFLQARYIPPAVPRVFRVAFSTLLRLPNITFCLLLACIAVFVGIQSGLFGDTVGKVLILPLAVGLILLFPPISLPIFEVLSWIMVPVAGLTAVLVVWKFLNGQCTLASVLWHTAALILFVLPFTGSFLYVGGAVLEKLNVALFISKPLEELIRTILRRRAKTTLFATVATPICYWDPDDATYFLASSPIAGNPSPQICPPLLHRAFLPIYQRVDSLPPETAAKVLLASAALPMGCVSHQLIEKAIVVDGGVVDNSPWMPLLGRCERIVIVRCSAGDWNDAGAKRWWIELDRLQRLLEVPIPPARDYPTRVRRVPPVEIPYRDRRLWRPEEVVTIAPESSLGNLLSGTLNFSAARARGNIRAGYEAGSQLVPLLKEFMCS